MVEDQIGEMAGKMLLYKTLVYQETEKALVRVGDLLEAYDLRGLENDTPAFRERAARMAPKVLKALDESVAELEKAIKKYYAIGGSKKIFKPAPMPPVAPVERRDEPKPPPSKNRFDL